ncbi:uncharacterized protein LOC134577213 isoform X2 [Pelobates fuscus]|uniref:uncharacterized protein LOC134577213 isoform X2 n=1 Tax=Pelobates fuscus TaxID=191477 RepID=UPI002FE45DE0
MAQLYYLVSIYLAIICNIRSLQALPRNSSCEHAGNCARAQVIPTICPAGHFCSEDGGKVTPCPAGSYRSGEELGALDHCTKCPVNFFNHLVGQKACLPCGSEAMQPKEGQITCLCHGEGRIFQPNDGRCPCAPGYRLAGDTNNCVQIVYDICRDGNARNQEGQCLSEGEWSDYCSNQICVQPKYFQGYDKVLGLCICQTEHLDNLCNAECRRRQKRILQILCVEETPKIRAIDSSGEQDVFGPLVVDHPVDKMICSSSQRTSVHSVYVVASTGQGFLGVYNANPQLIKQMSEGHFNITLSKLSGEDRMFTFYPVSGILNPTTCIHVNEVIMFIASKHDYPMYDVEKLRWDSSESERWTMSARFTSCSVTLF